MTVASSEQPGGKNGDFGKFGQTRKAQVSVSPWGRCVTLQLQLVRRSSLRHTNADHCGII